MNYIGLSGILLMYWLGLAIIKKKLNCLIKFEIYFQQSSVLVRGNRSVNDNKSLSALQASFFFSQSNKKNHPTSTR